ncbi:hypothetical protein SPWS13_4623 [Shewanella putrefaciens]|nr:hypothetical protein SPWS13_4623 [Shewanella putrefaciens]
MLSSAAFSTANQSIPIKIVAIPILTAPFIAVIFFVLTPFLQD